MKPQDYTLGYQTLPALPPLKIKLRDGRVLRRMYNNCFVQEFCCVCKQYFDAHRTHIWGIEFDSYVCYECAEKLRQTCKGEKVKVILV